MAKKRNTVPNLNARKRKPKQARAEAVEAPVAQAAPEVTPAQPALMPAPDTPMVHTEATDEPVQHAAKELKPFPPRKSGRRPWDVNLGGPQHTWERVTTPDDFIVFRFKDEPTEAQHALIHKYGFGYKAEAKEAYRHNDAAGRTYADKLAWYLRDLQRGAAEHSLAG